MFKILKARDDFFSIHNRLRAVLPTGTPIPVLLPARRRSGVDLVGTDGRWEGIAQGIERRLQPVPIAGLEPLVVPRAVKPDMPEKGLALLARARLGRENFGRIIGSADGTNAKRRKGHHNLLVGNTRGSLDEDVIQTVHLHTLHFDGFQGAEELWVVWAAATEANKPKQHSECGCGKIKKTIEKNSPGR